MEKELRTKFYLVRHGSTAWNEIVRFRGSADIPLSEKGLKQAEALARFLKDVKFSAIYTSPQRRARDTANIINKFQGLSIQERPELKSVNYGAWEGKLEGEVARDYPELYREYLEHIESFRFPQGETLEDLKDRSLRVINEALSTYNGRDILIVSHQVVTRVLICALLGISNALYWQIGQDPGCLNIFEHHRGKFYLKLLNYCPEFPD
ncbi:MAG: histidine phosphatase family protein [Caldiserica bacterium]|jgi:broad specificity phosphatase PhoE|nr:histidine phosphatase family protein [Caldisericota bacterium]